MPIHLGDCLEVLKTLSDNSVDSLVTDPPAGISFMGKDWDHHKGGRKEWCAWMESVMRECIRVMKPGAHGLVWAIPRTSHWTATALEDAGFKIKDQIFHLWGSGFPKSTNVGKQAAKAGILCQCGAHETEANLRSVQERIYPEVENCLESGEAVQSEVLRDLALSKPGYSRSYEGDCSDRAHGLDGRIAGIGERENDRGEESGMGGRQVHRAREGLCDDSQTGTPQSQTERLCAGAYSSDGSAFGQEIKSQGSCASQESQSGGQSDREFAAVCEPQGALGRAPQSRLHCSQCGKLTKETEGFGSHLKPAVEIWILVQKPLEKGLTISANVQRWGCGAINIDESRISVDINDPNQRKPSVQWQNANKPASTNFGSGGRPIENLNAQGRFPANLILSHSASCTEDGCDMFECPVWQLDQQSGILKSGAMNGVYKNTMMKNSPGIRNGKEVHLKQEASQGGASRFFYVAKISSRERNAGLDKSEYVWKEEVWQRPDLSLSMESISQLARGISEDILTASFKWNIDGFGSSITEKFLQDSRCITKTISKLITELRTSNCSQPLNIRESIQDAIRMLAKNGLSPADAADNISKLKSTTTDERTDSVLSVSLALLKELEEIKRAARSGNFHETVKPKKLMSYLIRMITPPGGTVLDPFTGSGSTGVAAAELGFGFIGIEQSPEYHAIAEARIAHATPN